MSKAFTVADSTATGRLFSPGEALPGSQTYVCATSMPTVPVKAVVKHTFGIPNGKRDKHLLQFTTSRANAEGQYGTATVNITIDVPAIGAVSTDVDNCIAYAKSFLGDATLLSELRNGII